MKMLKAVALLFLLTASLNILAKPKPVTKEYPTPCSVVWQAAKSAFKEHYEVLSWNAEDQTGSLATGSGSTGVWMLTFSLSRSSGGSSCTVSVTGHSGVIHNDKADLFKRIADALNDQQAPEGPIS